MTALDVLENILCDDNLKSFNFKYCLVNQDKIPFTNNNQVARPNYNEDFVDLFDLNVDNLINYRCLGISIQASKVCAIDIDHCVNTPFDKTTINDKALKIIESFKNCAYIEFSFSGTGIRIFFIGDNNPDYDNLYYTKNTKLGIEYYRPEGNARYVTITGKSIYSNKIERLTGENYTSLIKFLNFNMKRSSILRQKTFEDIKDDRSIDELLKITKSKYLSDYIFQDLWFSQAPGSGKDESERDYHLIAYIFENITQDKNKVKLLFESSPFFKSKDHKHICKWNAQDFRYYNYVYDNIRRKK